MLLEASFIEYHREQQFSSFPDVFLLYGTQQSVLCFEQVVLCADFNMKYKVTVRLGVCSIWCLLNDKNCFLRSHTSEIDCVCPEMTQAGETGPEIRVWNLARVQKTVFAASLQTL